MIFREIDNTLATFQLRARRRLIERRLKFARLKSPGLVPHLLAERDDLDQQLLRADAAGQDRLRERLGCDGDAAVRRFTAPAVVSHEYDDAYCTMFGQEAAK